MGESGQAIAIDANNNVYVTGVTTSICRLPIGRCLPFRPAFGGGASDAFVTEIDPTGATKIYSSYLGGNGDEDLENGQPVGGAIAVDTNFVTYVAGITTSTSGLAQECQRRAAELWRRPTDAFAAQVSAAAGSNNPRFFDQRLACRHERGRRANFLHD